jgi:hypothetical protein
MECSRAISCWRPSLTCTSKCTIRREPWGVGFALSRRKRRKTRRSDKTAPPPRLCALLDGAVNNAASFVPPLSPPHTQRVVRRGRCSHMQMPCVQSSQHAGPFLSFSPAGPHVRHPCVNSHGAGEVDRAHQSLPCCVYRWKRRSPRQTLQQRVDRWKRRSPRQTLQQRVDSIGRRFVVPGAARTFVWCSV